MKLDVLHADNHLLALRKPAGEPVAPDESGDESLLERGKRWIAQEFDKPGEVFLGVVHRLDRPVSGVVLLARTSKAAARLSAQFREHTVRKLYFGVSASTPHGAASGELVQWLVKDAASNTVRIGREGESGALLARTRYRVVGRADALVHLELEPLSGRPHQLRVACATLGAPLLGDLKYGARDALEDRSIALHAAELEVEHPTLRTRLVLRCQPPAKPWWSSRAAALGRAREGADQ